MTVLSSQRRPLSRDLLEAAVNALPTEPHEMRVLVYNLNYSSLTGQLQTMPALKDAHFSFGNEVRFESPLNVSEIKNPTKQMVISLFRQGRVEDINALRAEIYSAKWDFSNPLYRWNPAQNVFRLREENKFPDYAPEIKLEDALEDADKIFKGFLRVSDREYFIHAERIIKKESMPSSKVVIDRLGIFVTYGIREPSYLPALVKALEGSGNLTIQRNL